MCENFTSRVTARWLKGVVFVTLTKRNGDKCYADVTPQNRKPCDAQTPQLSHARHLFVTKRRHFPGLSKHTNTHKNMSLFNFFGRDTQFFDLLESSATEAHNSAAVLQKLHSTLGSANIETLLGDLAQARRKHKRVAQDITTAVIKVFVTPIEREDIESLSSTLYRISKTLEKIGERFTVCPPGAKLDTLAKEISNIVHATTVVQQLISTLRKGATLDNIRDAHERIQAIEGDADKVLLEHLRELFRSEQDARLIIFWKDVYDLLEKATDRCRDVGNVVFSIVLKNS